MGRGLTIISTALVSSALTSVFWFLAFNTQVEVKPAPFDAKRTLAIAEVAPVKAVVGPKGLAIPVSGVTVAGLVDTFSDARAGGDRVHDAIDIMAPSGTAVLSATPGRVEKLFYSKGGGGVSAYVRSLDGRWSYYYSHLQEYAPGLAEGQRVRRGDVIGKVGFTGNANAAGPHLHFAVNRMAAGEKWYGGRAVNPYPLLAGNAVSSVPASAAPVSLLDPARIPSSSRPQ